MITVEDASICFFSIESFVNGLVSDTAMARPKLYKSGHTQTSQNTTILYYHESKKAALEETLPLLEEEDVDQAIADEEKTAHSQYKWKRRVPSSKFGVIIKAEGKRTDQMFEDEVLSFDGEWNLYGFLKINFLQILMKQKQQSMESNMKKMPLRSLSKYLE